MLTRLWELLNGRKTWLGLIVTFLPQFVDLVAKVITAGGGSAESFVKLAGIVMLILGALHKLVKGQ